MQKDIDVAAMLSNAENAAKWLKPSPTLTA